MPAWLSNTAAKALAIVAIVALVLGLVALRSCNTARTAGTAEKLATGQRGAAIDSGADSVSTTGNVQTAAEQRAETVKDGNHAIDQAPAGNSNGAAERASCELRSYRHSSRCIDLLGPVAP